MPGVIRQAGVEHAIYPGVFNEVVSKSERTLAVTLHAHMKRLDSARR